MNIEEQLKEADRRAGEAERKLSYELHTNECHKSWLHKAKQQWGVDDSVSFDIVWAECLELKRQQLAQQLSAKCTENSYTSNTPSVDVLINAAKAVVDRWDTPLWKDVPHTAEFIHKLRDALQAMNEAKPIEKDVK